MEEVPYSRILREGWALILVATILGGLIAFGAAKLLPRTYSATSTLMLRVESTSASLFEQNQFSLARVKSYTQLVYSPTVVDGVREELGLGAEDYSDRDIRRMLTATNIPDTALLEVEAEASTGERAAELANVASLHLAEAVDEAESPTLADDQVIQLVQIRPAVPPTSPTSPRTIPIVGLGLITGVAVGAILALYRTTRNRRVTTVQDVRECADLPVIGQIPAYKGRRTRTEPQRLSYLEAASNALALVGRPDTGFVLVPATPDLLDVRVLAGLADGFAGAGQRTIVLDVRTEGAPSEPPVSLQDLRGQMSSSPGETGKAENEHSVDLLSVTSERTTNVFVVTSAPATALSSELPLLINDLNQIGEMVLVVADPNATATLAALDMPLLIAVQAAKTEASDLLSTTVRLRAMNRAPLGVLITGSRNRTSPVAQTWQEADYAGRLAQH